MKYLILLICIVLGLLHAAAVDFHSFDKPNISMCSNGYYVNEFCCIQKKDAWFTKSVLLEDVDYMWIAPYSCANPSYCTARMYGNGDVVAVGPPVNAFDFSGSNMHFSEQHYSCGDISWIMCKLVNPHTRQWECYAKMPNDSMLLVFTQDLKCEYVEQPHGTELVVGSCVINQITRDYTYEMHNMPRRYDALSTNTPLSFMPILNPMAAEMLRAQSGINRVILRNETVMMPAFLPATFVPPSYNDSALTARVETLEYNDNMLLHGLFFGFFLILMDFLIQLILSCILKSKINALKKEENISPTTSEDAGSTSNTEEELELFPLKTHSSTPVQMYPANPPSSIQLEFIDIESKI
jgi:hypothetical protein